MLAALDDIASDLSAVHHVWIDPAEGDYGRLTGPAFFRLAERLHHHRGSVREFWADAVHAHRERDDDVISAVELVTGDGLGDVIEVEG